MELSYSSVLHIRNHILSLRSKPISYGKRSVSKECSSFLFEEFSSVLGLN